MIIKESPLRGMTTGTVETAAIRELPGLDTVDLRVEPASASFDAVTKTLGIDLPLKVGSTSIISLPGKEDAHALCLGQGWWLLVGLPEGEKSFDTLRLNNNFHFSATNVSGQRTTIELEGPDARQVLTRLWEQDLREKAFPVGSVSQGLMAKAPVILLHTDANRYRIMVRSSFALHLWKAIKDALEGV